MVCVVAPVDQWYEAKPPPASSVTGEPAQVVDGPVIDGAGTALIGMVTLEALLQPPFETVTFSVTLPEAPAVKEIAFVPAPPLIVPLVMLQLYVAPPCAGTLALAAADAQTDAGAVIAADGATVI